MQILEKTRIHLKKDKQKYLFMSVKIILQKGKGESVMIKTSKRNIFRMWTIGETTDKILFSFTKKIDIQISPTL